MNYTLYLCFIIFQTPASSIPDTLSDLRAAPGCQRKYQQAFTRQGTLLPCHSASQAPLLLAPGHLRQTSSTADPHQPNRPRCFCLVLFITTDFLTFQRTLLFFSRLKKNTKPHKTSHKTLSRNNKTRNQRGIGVKKRKQKQKTNPLQKR